MTSHAQQNDIDDYFSSERTSGRSELVELSSTSYRDHLIDVDDPMLADARGMGYEEFSADKHQAPFLADLLDYWTSLYEEPFLGITTDGTVDEGLYRLPEELSADPEPAEAGARLLSLLSSEQRETVSYRLDAPEWRAWSNPEFVVFRTGLRLEEQAAEVVEAILDVVRSSLSPEGYDRVRATMRLNGSLGELVDLPEILNSGSYWFSIFGTPDAEQPWGWQLHGHHLALNFVTVGGRHVIAPAFIGAEPTAVDADRPGLFDTRERIALDLAGSLTPEQRESALVYDSVLDPDMPEGRLHPADERHVAGAFRDNRVIAYEGIRADALTDAQWSLVRDIVEDNLLLLKRLQRELTLRDVDAHRDETHLSWYGATDGSQPFYLRIHSPVFFSEVDHHAGVWLGNRLPADFHVHTLHRHPNGNDYGKAYLAEWFRRVGNSGG